MKYFGVFMAWHTSIAVVFNYVCFNFSPKTVKAQRSSSWIKKEKRKNPTQTKEDQQLSLSAFMWTAMC